MIPAMAETVERRRRPSLPTLLLALAALLALGAVAVALLRGKGEESAVAPGHPAVTPGQSAPDMDTMIARVEARLREDPDDAEAWRMLGWLQFEARRPDRAAAAYRRAAELEPGNAENWSSYGEALQVATDQVSEEAGEAFRRALRLDPKDPRARYFLAVQKDLRGQHAEAVEDWIALLRDTPAGAPWEADLRRTILQVAEANDITIEGRLPPPSPPQAAAADAIPGPTREQMAAASSLPPGQQQEMVRGMVERLAQRLRDNPRDADGWIRLMRSRMVLGERDAAREALRSGLTAFQGDAAAQQRLRAAASELGVPAA
jgi:cytochrome c-type biogenesis protein CcmH